MINEASSPGASLDQGCRPDSEVGLPDRERIAQAILNPWVAVDLAVCRRNDEWSHCLDCADAILALLSSATPAMQVDTPSSETLSR